MEKAAEDSPGVAWIPTRTCRGRRRPAAVDALIASIALTAVARGAEFDVRRFGARGDGETSDRAALQAALDACAAVGGGTVVLPPGRYLSGGLTVKSGVTVRIEPGATVLLSTRAEDYGSSRRLFNAERAAGIAIEGGGTIDGRATADFGDRWGVREAPTFRTGILLFDDCTNVAVRNVLIRHSDSWTLHFRGCEGVEVDSVEITNNYRRLNSDGIDPNMCRRVRITRCRISAGDDCVVLKATGSRPCEDILVAECDFESAATAIKLGTESHGDFRRIVFTNCVVRNSPTGIGLYAKDGGSMEDVRFSDIRIETSSLTNRSVAPVFVDIERRHATSRVSRIRNVVFENLEIRSRYSALLQGMPERPLEGLVLRNVRFEVDGAADFSDRRKPVGGRRTTRDERDSLFATKPAYVVIAHARGVTVENLAVRIPDEVFARFPRAALGLYGVENVRIAGLSRAPSDESRAPALDRSDR